jgi:hypothetical protein
MYADFIDKGKALLAKLDAVKIDQEKMKEDNRLYTVRRKQAVQKIINSINEAGRKDCGDDPFTQAFYDSPWTKSSKS